MENKEFHEYSQECVVKYRNDTSPSGYPIDLLISAIQKYLRKRKPTKMIWSVTEIVTFSFKELSDKTQISHRKGILTNLKNRLSVMLCEELCYTEGGILIKCHNYLQKWYENPTETKHLVKFCKMICKGELCRLPSYYSCGYTLDYEGEFHDSMNETLGVPKDLKKKYETEEEKWLYLYKKLLEDGSLTCIYYLMKLIHNPHETTLCEFNGKKKQWNCDYGIWPIMKKYLENNKIRGRERMVFNIFSSEFHEFHKKSGDGFKGDRKVFAINATLMVLRRKNMKWDYAPCTVTAKDKTIFFTDRVYLKIDDYCYDQHTKDGRNMGRDKGSPYFGVVSSVVYKENLERLEIPRFRILYMASKSGLLNKEQRRIRHIPFSEFTNYKILYDGVCAGKRPCIKVEYRGFKFVLKDCSTKGMNDGKDYFLTDTLKPLFGIEHLELERITSDRIQEKKDSSLKTFVTNSILVKGNCTYCMMIYKKNIGDVGKNKNLILSSENLQRQLCKIMLFKGIFRSSDNIVRNVLVSPDKKRLISIDEGDLFGKREQIFQGNCFCRNNVSHELIMEECEKLLDVIEYKIPFVENIMRKMDMKDKIPEMRDRIKNYSDIVRKDLKN